MRLLWFIPAASFMALSLCAAPVFGPAVDPSAFRVTLFASGLQYPQSMQPLSDGSIAIQTSPSWLNAEILRFVDANADGIADVPGVPIHSAPSEGPSTQLTQAGSYFIQGNYGSNSIVILEPGATPASAMTEIGRLEFNYPSGWNHDQIGVGVRPTPNQPGFYDLAFNVGARYDGVASDASVAISNLIDGTLNGDSLYMVTLDLRTNTPVASNLRQIASGIRNVFGLGFDADGNLWFSDNARNFADPFQAEELNRILADELGILIPNFGFPNCYTDLSGAVVSPGCTQPEAAFIPYLGMLSQGATQIAFSPHGFPSQFGNGIFVFVHRPRGRGR